MDPFHQDWDTSPLWIPLPTPRIPLREQVRRYAPKEEGGGSAEMESRDVLLSSQIGFRRRQDLVRLRLLLVGKLSDTPTSSKVTNLRYVSHV